MDHNTGHKDSPSIDSHSVFQNLYSTVGFKQLADSQGTCIALKPNRIEREPEAAVRSCRSDSWKIFSNWSGINSMLTAFKCSCSQKRMTFWSSVCIPLPLSDTPDALSLPDLKKPKTTNQLLTANIINEVWEMKTHHGFFCLLLYTLLRNKASAK